MREMRPHPYYFKINKSFFRSGITIPASRIVDFIFDEPIEAGSSRKVDISWKGKDFKAVLRHVNQGQRGATYYALRLDTNPELIAELSKEFIHTYIAVFSQELKLKVDGNRHVTMLKGGQEEVVIIKPVSKDRIELETFIKIETPYDELFSRMIADNVFGWLTKADKSDTFIQHSGKWHDISELPSHKEIKFVVYYLLDEEGEKLYIGSAHKLGERVKPNRDVIPSWNKFRYDIIKPEHHSKLVMLEYFAIMSYARLLNNAGGKSTLGLGDLVLVNKDYRYYGGES
jgi:hypothetical protein